ncbi:hypothetical protein Tco_0689348 [Tanacetum coccineum]
MSWFSRRSWCGGLSEGFCFICASSNGNSSNNDLNSNSFNDPPNDFTYPPQPQYETYLCELCGNNSHYVQKEQEEQTAQSFTPYWNFPMINDDDKDYTIQFKEYLENSSKAITPDLPIEEPDNSLSMEDEHLNAILETESDEVIKSSVEDLVPITRESEGISDDTCDVSACENSSTFDALKNHSLILSDSNDDGTLSDDDDFEDIEYVEASPPDSELVSLEEVNDVDREKEEIDLKDIL